MSLITRIPSKALALLLLVALSSCSTVLSRVDQCKALATAKAPKLSKNASYEEQLASQKASLEGYKKVSLNEQDLKQFRDQQVSYIEQSIVASQKSIDLEKELKNNPKNDEAFKKLVSQIDKNYEIQIQLIPLINEYKKLCPYGSE